MDPKALNEIIKDGDNFLKIMTEAVRNGNFPLITEDFRSVHTGLENLESLEESIISSNATTNDISRLTLGATINETLTKLQYDVNNFKTRIEAGLTEPDSFNKGDHQTYREHANPLIQALDITKAVSKKIEAALKL